MRMPNGDLENLAEVQRETVRALAVLTEQLRAVGDTGIAGQREGEALRRGDDETAGQRDDETSGHRDAGAGDGGSGIDYRCEHAGGGWFEPRVGGIAGIAG